MQIRAAVAVLGATLLAACVIFGQTGERFALMSSGTEEYRWAPLQHLGCRSNGGWIRGGADTVARFCSTGSKDVLTSVDFVPLGGAGSAGHMSKAAQNEL